MFANKEDRVKLKQYDELVSEQQSIYGNHDEAFVNEEFKPTGNGVK
jgi:hypothetical protein